MKLTKWRLASTILATVLLGSTAAYATHVFDDVPDDAFYADPVEWAADNAITTGKSPTQFAPLDPVTRGESVTFLKRYHDNLAQPGIDAAQGAADAAQAAAEAAQEDADANASAIDSMQTVELRIGGAAFTGDGDITYTTACSASTDGSLMRAGVPVPVGATITGFGGRFTGTGGELDLVRIDATTGSIGSLTTTSSSFDIEETELATPEVVDEDKFYHLEWDPNSAGTSDRICGAIIHYTLDG